MVDPKKQDFWPKINKLKGNHCILRIWRAPVHQKFGMILENKAVQKFESTIETISFEHVDSWVKVLHFRTHHL
jgi:hypothetical protein